MKVFKSQNMSLKEWKEHFPGEEALEELQPWEDEDDIFTSAEVIDKILCYHGIIGYTGWILSYVENAYGVSISDSDTIF